MSVDLKSSSKRNELKPRREPYWHRIEAGLFVGYRRIETGKGTWIARRRNDEGKQQYKALGTIDTLDKAVSLASAWGATVEQGVQHTTTTVKMACEAYVLHLKDQNTKASAKDAEGRFKRLVYDEPIGKIALDKLRTTALRTWMQKQLNDDGDEEDLRRSKDSANRNLNTLKAALNLALKDRLVGTDAGWRTVSIFPKAGKRRTGDLSPADLQNLLKSCGTVQIAGLVRALMLTAVRPGEIAASNVGDFNKDQGSMVLTGKTGTRTVTLSTAAVEFFKECAKDKLPGAPLLTDEYGNRWNKDSWKKPFREACVAAELPDDVVMYTLRHAAISNMIAGGVDTFVVARLAGTSTTMIDKHYGHLRHDQTRAKLDQAHAATG